MVIIPSRRQGFMGNDGYTKLLLHFDGADAASTTVDSSRSGHIMTMHNAVLDTDQAPVFGSASCKFDGTQDAVHTPVDADFNIGAGDFTVDFRIRWASLNLSQNIFYAEKDSNNIFYLLKVAHDDGSKPNALMFGAYVSGSTACEYVTTTWTPSADTWYHIALVRNGATIYIFVEGVSQALTESSAIGTDDIGVGDGGAIDQFTIGARSGWSESLNGWIDEFRFSKGIARWTANFTPPSVPYR